jgi:hypothetical protein
VTLVTHMYHASRARRQHRGDAYYARWSSEGLRDVCRGCRWIYGSGQGMTATPSKTCRTQLRQFPYVYMSCPSGGPGRETFEARDPRPEVRFGGLPWRHFWVIGTTRSPLTRVVAHCFRVSKADATKSSETSDGAWLSRSRQILRNLNEAADSATRRAAPNSRVNSRCAHQVRLPLDSQLSARRRGVVAHLVTRKTRPRRFRYSYRKATMGSTRVARDAGR